MARAENSLGYAIEALWPRVGWKRISTLRPTRQQAEYDLEFGIHLTINPPLELRVAEIVDTKRKLQ